jgi:hypothetical protein
MPEQPNAPLSLTARLLCAAFHAYAIKVTGPAPVATQPPTPPRSTLVGYVTTPQAFAVGIDRIDAGLVGITSTEIVVAFRGTLPPDSPDTGQMILDWLDDCDAALVPEPGMPGLVHQGFRDALNSLWGDMGPVLDALVKANPTKPICFTGHSKGGAVAVLAAMRCHILYPAAKIYVCTFAAPRSGDNAFANGYDKEITNSARYEFQDDIVPHVPPDDFFITMFGEVPFLAEKVKELTPGYVSVGTLHFIDWSGKLVGDSPTLRFERFTHLAHLMVEFGFKTIIADHSLDPGYALAVLGSP